MPIRSMTCFIVSTGHGDPAITPVRNDDTSRSASNGSLSIAMNMVGTP